MAVDFHWARPHPARSLLGEPRPITAEKCNSAISQGNYLQQDVTVSQPRRLLAGRMPSMPVRQIIEGGRVPVKVFTDDLEAHARAQLANVAQLPIVHGHIAAMPDVHAGIGATIGSVIPTKGAIVPAAVGVDIGCGCNAVQLSITAQDLPQSLRAIRSAIESAVPVGFDMHASGGLQGSGRDKSARALAKGLEKIVARSPAIASMQKNFAETWRRQLGTLGG